MRPTVKTPADRFTGDVYRTPIRTGTGPSRMTAALVRFTPGALLEANPDGSDPTTWLEPVTDHRYDDAQQA